MCAALWGFHGKSFWRMLTSRNPLCLWHLTKPRASHRQLCSDGSRVICAKTEARLSILLESNVLPPFFHLAFPSSHSSFYHTSLGGARFDLFDVIVYIYSSGKVLTTNFYKYDWAKLGLPIYPKYCTDLLHATSVGKGAMWKFSKALAW